MLVCKECGSKSIQVKAWVDANTSEYCSDASDGDTDDNWCEVCCSHVRFITEEEFNEEDKEER